MRPADRRVLAELQYLGPSTSEELGASLDRTGRAVRLRLIGLERRGLVARDRRQKPHVWRIADYGAGLQAYEEERAAAASAIRRLVRRSTVYREALRARVQAL